MHIVQRALSQPLPLYGSRRSRQSLSPPDPESEESMPYFKYRLRWAYGEDAGEAEIAVRIRVGGPG